MRQAKWLEELDKTAHREFKWWIAKDKKFFTNFINNKYNQILIAFEGKTIIGYLGMEFNKDRKSTWINEIYIIRVMRKKRVAKELVKEALKKWNKKSKSVVLLTADRNLKTFENLGFKKTMNFMEYAGGKK